MKVKVKSLITEGIPTQFDKRIWAEGTLPAISNRLENFLATRTCFVTMRKGTFSELNTDKAIKEGWYCGVVTRIQLKNGQAELTIDTLNNEQGKLLEKLVKTRNIAADFLMQATGSIQNGYITIDLNSKDNKLWKVYPIVRLVDVQEEMDKLEKQVVKSCPACILGKCNNINLNQLFQRVAGNNLECRDVSKDLCLLKQYLSWTNTTIGKTKKGKKELEQWAQYFQTGLLD